MGLIFAGLILAGLILAWYWRNIDIHVIRMHQVNLILIKAEYIKEGVTLNPQTHCNPPWTRWGERDKTNTAVHHHTFPWFSNMGATRRSVIQFRYLHMRTPIHAKDLLWIIFATWSSCAAHSTKATRTVREALLQQSLAGNNVTGQGNGLQDQCSGLGTYTCVHPSMQKTCSE